MSCGVNSYVFKLCNVTSGGCLGSAGIKKKNGGRRGGEACRNSRGGGKGRVSRGAWGGGFRLIWLVFLLLSGGVHVSSGFFVVSRG